MNTSAKLQDCICRALTNSGLMPAGLPVVAWRSKDAESDMNATLAAQKGLCIYVPMPLPTHCLQHAQEVFFDAYEVRVQIVELPDQNRGGVADLYDLLDAVALALHWQPKSVESPLAGILAHPLMLAERPVEMAEGVVAVPGFEHNGQVVRAADVIFRAVLQVRDPN